MNIFSYYGHPQFTPFANAWTPPVHPQQPAFFPPFYGRPMPQPYQYAPQYTPQAYRAVYPQPMRTPYYTNHNPYGTRPAPAYRAYFQPQAQPQYPAQRAYAGRRAPAPQRAPHVDATKNKALLKEIQKKLEENRASIAEIQRQIALEQARNQPLPPAAPPTTHLPQQEIDEELAYYTFDPDAPVANPPAIAITPPPAAPLPPSPPLTTQPPIVPAALPQPPAPPPSPPALAAPQAADIPAHDHGPSPQMIKPFPKLANNPILPAAAVTNPPAIAITPPPAAPLPPSPPLTTQPPAPPPPPSAPDAPLVWPVNTENDDYAETLRAWMETPVQTPPPPLPHANAPTEPTSPPIPSATPEPTLPQVPLLDPLVNDEQETRQRLEAEYAKSTETYMLIHARRVKTERKRLRSLAEQQQLQSLAEQQQLQSLAEQQQLQSLLEAEHSLRTLICNTEYLQWGALNVGMKRGLERIPSQIPAVATSPPVDEHGASQQATPAFQRRLSDHIFSAPEHRRHQKLFVQNPPVPAPTPHADAPTKPTLPQAPLLDPQKKKSVQAALLKEARSLSRFQTKDQEQQTPTLTQTDWKNTLHANPQGTPTPTTVANWPGIEQLNRMDVESQLTNAMTTLHMHMKLELLSLEEQSARSHMHAHETNSITELNQHFATGLTQIAARTSFVPATAPQPTSTLGTTPDPIQQQTMLPQAHVPQDSSPTAADFDRDWNRVPYGAANWKDYLHENQPTPTPAIVIPTTSTEESEGAVRFVITNEEDGIRNELQALFHTGLNSIEQREQEMLRHLAVLNSKIDSPGEDWAAQVSTVTPQGTAQGQPTADTETRTAQVAAQALPQQDRTAISQRNAFWHNDCAMVDLEKLAMGRTQPAPQHTLHKGVEPCPFAQKADGVVNVNPQQVQQLEAILAAAEGVDLERNPRMHIAYTKAQIAYELATSTNPQDVAKYYVEQYAAEDFDMRKFLCGSAARPYKAKKPDLIVGDMLKENDHTHEFVVQLRECLARDISQHDHIEDEMSYELLKTLQPLYFVLPLICSDEEKDYLLRMLTKLDLSNPLACLAYKEQIDSAYNHVIHCLADSNPSIRQQLLACIQNRATQFATPQDQRLVWLPETKQIGFQPLCIRADTGLPYPEAGTKKIDECARRLFGHALYMLKGILFTPLSREAIFENPRAVALTEEVRRCEISFEEQRACHAIQQAMIQDQQHMRAAHEAQEREARQRMLVEETAGRMGLSIAELQSKESAMRYALQQQGFDHIQPPAEILRAHFSQQKIQQLQTECIQIVQKLDKARTSTPLPIQEEPLVPQNKMDLARKLQSTSCQLSRKITDYNKAMSHVKHNIHQIRFILDVLQLDFEEAIKTASDDNIASVTASLEELTHQLEPLSTELKTLAKHSPHLSAPFSLEQLTTYTKNAYECALNFLTALSYAIDKDIAEPILQKRIPTVDCIIHSVQSTHDERAIKQLNELLFKPYTDRANQRILQRNIAIETRERAKFPREKERAECREIYDLPRILGESPDPRDEEEVRLLINYAKTIDSLLDRMHAEEIPGFIFGEGGLDLLCKKINTRIQAYLLQENTPPEVKEYLDFCEKKVDLDALCAFLKAVINGARPLADA